EQDLDSRAAADSKTINEVENRETDDSTPKLYPNTHLIGASTDTNITVEPDQLDLTENTCPVLSEAIPSDDLTYVSLNKKEEKLDLSSADLQVHSLESSQLENMEAEKPNAVCRYRWTKAMLVNCDDIGFYPSYSPDTPVLLSWNDKTMAYFSNELRIPAGDYQGNLIVNGQLYPTEEFSVRSYTFEVDLYMKDADEIMSTDNRQDTSMLEKDISPAQASDSLEFYPKSFHGLEHVNSKAAKEDGHLNHDRESDEIFDVQKDCQEKPSTSSIKSDDISLSSMKRHSPVGNDDAGTFSEYNFDQKYNVGHLEEQNTKQEHKISNGAFIKSSIDGLKQPGAGIEFVEDVVRPSSALYSDVNSKTGTQAETETRVQNSRPPSLGADSAHRSHHNLLKHSLSMDSIYGRPESKASDRFSPDNHRKGDTDVLGHHYTSDTDPDKPRATKSPVNFMQTTISKDGTSPAVILGQEYSRSTPQREITGDNIYEHRRKRAESGEPISSGSSLSGRPPSHPSSRYGSQNPSRTQSLTSVISDQELAQLFEHSGPSSAGSLQPRSGAVDPCNAREAERRSTSASNLASQSQVLSNSREFLPPKSSVLNEREKLKETYGRSSDMSRVSSQANSRTVTPVSFDTGNKEVNNDRIQDLEVLVQNLKKLLASRETEAHSLNSQLEDLKEINRSLREDLDHRARRYTPVSSVQDSFEYKQLQSEKEILASEVVSLRAELQRLKKGQTGSRYGVSGITDYSPNSPTVLQRKIVDLEAHIQDLHEVTEATNSSLTRAEEKLKISQEENKDLKSRPYNKSDLQTELRTLREDIKNLNERNQKLTEENLWLRQSQKEASRFSTKEEPKYKSASSESRHQVSVKEKPPVYSNGEHRHTSLRSDDVTVRPTSAYTSSPAYRYGSSSLADGVTDRSHVVSSSPVSSKKISYEDQELEEIRHVNQAYDLNQRHESQLHQFKPRSDSYHHRSDYSNKRTDSSHNRNDYSHNRMDSSHHSNSSHHRYQSRSDSSTRSIESSRAGLQYPDRSKPDGEVSEKSYTDKYIRSPYDKQPFEDRRSYLDKHSSYGSQFPRGSTEIWSQERFDGDMKENKYGYINDGVQDRDARVKSLDRLSSPRAAISSRDIYLNLQQKRANKWLQQEERKEQLPSLHDDNDSDSTLVLMAGFTTDLIKEKDVLNQPRATVKGKEKEDLTCDNNKYISGNLGLRLQQPSRTFVDNPGDDSDTATDILLTQNVTSKGLVRRRKTSLGSEGSPSSLSDFEDHTDTLLKRRSKSVDAKRGQTRQVSARHRSDSASQTATSTEHMNVGFRSVIPTPLVTQQNKGEIISKHTSLLSSSLTQGLRPFAPRCPGDIRVDDVVKFSSHGGKLTQGVVKYVGHLPGRSETYFGVELDKDEGKHDGTFEGVRYFKCKPNKGVFVSFNKVVMAWAP
ncbi:unnamed protein product, partial [Candidula unifasciata]